jgi:hypothetical protein
VVLSPFDDFPIHQIAEPIRYVGTSDRNFYDRWYFNGHRRADDVFFVVGMGQYPNLGTADAFAAVTWHGTQHVVRASRELGTDRSNTTVGPFEIDVIEGLRLLRVTCGPNDSGVEFDLTWNGTILAVEEPRHFYRHGARVASDTMRFAQTGTWKGRVAVGTDELQVDPSTWRGGRDRSWGIRPVGEPEPPGARASQPSSGFFWIYSTMQFDDYTIVAIVHEDRTGARTLEEGIRVWRDDKLRTEQLGRPEHAVHFTDGTRTPRQAVLSFPTVGLEVRVEPLTAVHLGLGTGYGVDADWRHGMWHGPLAVESRTYDLTDPAVRRRPGIVDHLARFETNDRETGYGLFEFAMLGPNDRYVY